MDRSEILARSRMDNQHHDERERRVTDKACTWGAVSMAISAAAIFFIRLLAKGGNPYDLLAILFAYLAAAHAYTWSKSRSRWTLITAAACTVGAAALLCAYALLD